MCFKGLHYRCIYWRPSLREEDGWQFLIIHHTRLNMYTYHLYKLEVYRRTNIWDHHKNKMCKASTLRSCPGYIHYSSANFQISKSISEVFLNNRKVDTVTFNLWRETSLCRGSEKSAVLWIKLLPLRYQWYLLYMSINYADLFGILYIHGIRQNGLKVVV